jgi:LysR family nitrogen assimilation transcriptional regulator
MDLRQIRYFVTVAKSGSFTGASHALHISQPALGLKVKQLEDRLGTKLLERHSRGVALTKAGAIFYEQAIDILDRVERAKTSLLPFKNGQKLDLHFGVTPSTARTIIPEVLEACACQTSPAIRVTVQQGHATGLLERAEAKYLDMAFCFGVPKSDWLGAIPLYDEDLVLVGPRDLLGDESDIPFQELSKFPLIMSGAHRGARKQVDRAAARCGIELTILHEIEAINLKRDLLLRNRCCGIVSAGFFLGDLQNGTLAARRIVAPTLSRDFSLVFRLDLPRTVIDFIASTVLRIVEQRCQESLLRWRRTQRAAHYSIGMESGAAV